MKFALALIAVLALSCRISPVITDKADPSSDRYSECKRAAREYCKHVVDPAQSEMDGCVAKYAFECVSGISS
jgi:hypothetical protein